MQLHTTSLHMNWKAHVACNFSCLFEKGFSKVTGSHVHCKCGASRKVKSLLLQTTNRKWYMTYWIAAILMTLKSLQLTQCVVRFLCDSWASCLHNTSHSILRGHSFTKVKKSPAGCCKIHF